MTTNNSTQQSENKGILVSKELLSKLRSALSLNKNPMDKLASDREILDNVVQQMAVSFGNNRLYSKVIPKPENCYRYFDSDVVRMLREHQDSILDLGRFVDACIIAYLWGPQGLQRYCVSSRIIYPQRLEEEKLLRIQQKAAEIADSQVVDSKFVPGSFTEE